jgi:hypothetical protein
MSLTVRPHSKSMNKIIFFAFLFLQTYSIWAQDLSASNAKSTLELQEKQIRKIKGANARKVDDILVDTLIDDGWTPSGPLMKNSTKYRTARKLLNPGKNVCYQEVSPKNFYKLPFFSDLEYQIKEKDGELFVRVIIVVPNCVEFRDDRIRTKIYDRFWEAVGKSLFLDSVAIESSTLD